jgi:hypothetical protein
VGALVPFVTGVAQADVFYPVGDTETLSLSVTWETVPLTAPVEQGTQLGTLEVRCADQVVAKVPIVARQTAACNLAPTLTPLERLFQTVQGNEREKKG